MQTKKKAFAVFGVAVVFAAAIFLFKGNDPDQEWIEGSFHSDNLAEIEKMPPLSEPIFVAMSGRTVEALQKKNYKQATSMAISMTGWQGMTPEQSLTLRNSIQNLKVALGAAALEGDTNAQAALEFFKSHSAAGR